MECQFCIGDLGKFEWNQYMTIKQAHHQQTKNESKAGDDGAVPQKRCKINVDLESANDFSKIL